MPLNRDNILTIQKECKKNSGIQRWYQRIHLEIRTKIPMINTLHIFFFGWWNNSNREIVKEQYAWQITISRKRNQLTHGTPVQFLCFVIESWWPIWGLLASGWLPWCKKSSHAMKPSASFVIALIFHSRNCFITRQLISTPAGAAGVAGLPASCLRWPVPAALGDGPGGGDGLWSPASDARTGPSGASARHSQPGTKMPSLQLNRSCSQGWNNLTAAISSSNSSLPTPSSLSASIHPRHRTQTPSRIKAVQM